ncbi:hypothetical protein IW261DRAFT_1576159 [Armillaria novae-zelandiae]|uniref:Peptidase C14 caspase domain-containing protein n=1 Tax=Armillaria novae-zelandiae TaxID=153914 RepID=A0AA39NBW6_9AGAR|nr:hypothetical protein IW261DRAFT_1576159 [Armillaria novae-zelandiae]
MMQHKPMTERTASSGPLGTDSQSGAHKGPFEDTSFYQGLALYADAGRLADKDRTPTARFLRLLQQAFVKVRSVIAVTVQHVLQIDCRFSYRRNNNTVPLKGFTSAGTALADDHLEQLTVEEIDTDQGGLLQQERLKALSDPDDAHAHQEYKERHQRWARLFQCANRFRQRPLRLIANVAKRPSPSSDHGSLHRRKPFDSHQFWCILIGIDGYHENPLDGCVADVRIMEDYMTGVLGVPKEHIQRLLGERSDSSKSIRNTGLPPIRANIVKTLHGLSTNSGIKKGDSIVIFFSGHGSSYQCPDCLRIICGDSRSSCESSPPPDSTEEIESHQHRCPIEALCPIDRDTPDDEGVPIPDISDREINNILKKIHDVTEAHITVILDCCHSGGITKAPLLDGNARIIHSLGEESFVRMLDSAQDSMRDWPGYRDVWEQKWCPDMGSHVVLAACRDYQFAKETQCGGGGYKGVFTTGIVRTLTSGTLGEGSTYVDLIKALPQWESQTPVVAGRRKNEHLWH